MPDKDTPNEIKKFSTISLWFKITGGLLCATIVLTLIPNFLDNNYEWIEIFDWLDWLAGLLALVFAAFIPLYFKEQSEFTSYHYNCLKKELDKYEQQNVKLTARNKELEYKDFVILGSLKPSFDWLYSRSSIVRSNQSFALTLEDCVYNNEPVIRVNGIHKYTLTNSTKQTLNIPVNLITELGLQSIGSGGFTKVEIITKSERKVYEGETLKRHTNYDRRKLTGAVFNLKLEIPVGEYISFAFHTFGIFRLTDRFVWYTQDFCEGCEITITNNTQFENPIHYQINHHEHEEIEYGAGRIKWTPELKQDSISFDSPIYPYEGFFMYWDFTNSH